MRGLLVVMAALLALAVGSTPAEAATHVVAIGNNLGASGDLPLKYAERDAQRFAAVLNRYGDVTSGNTTVALGETATAVRAMLLKKNAAMRASGQDDVLIVFYSGHADARGLHMGRSTLPFRELRNMVAASPAAVRVLVVDACRSGGVTRVKGIRRSADEFVIKVDDRSKVEGFAIITSSAAGEDSQESERLRASFFSHHLITALRGAGDKNRDRLVSLDEAYNYSYQQTLRSSGQTLQLQHPTYKFDMKGRGQLILTRLKKVSRSGKLTLSNPGTYLVIEGRQTGPVVAEAVVGSKGATLVLPPRRYFVQHRAPRFYREYDVRLSRGQTTALKDQEFRTVAYARLLRKGGGDRSAVGGILLFGGVRGPVLDGYGPSPQLTVGGTLDLKWLTLGLRARIQFPVEASPDGALTATHSEYALMVTAQRFIDFPWVSLALGVVLEGAYHRQTYATGGKASARDAASFGIGVLATLQFPLTDALSLQFEGGPMTSIFERATVSAGAVVGRELATPLTYWAAGGLVWRL